VPRYLTISNDDLVDNHHRVMRDQEFEKLSTVDQIQYIKERSGLSKSKSREREGASSSQLDQYQDSHLLPILPQINGRNSSNKMATETS